MGVDPAIDITTEQRETILALLEEHLPDTAAWIYGSRVKWTSRPQSDLDLVVFATPEQGGRVGDLREAFEESNLSFRVDLFVWDDVPEAFRKQIELSHVVLVTGKRTRFGKGVPFGANKWQRVDLNDVVEIFDGPHATPKKTRSGPVFLGIGNLSSGRIDLTKTEHLNEEDYVQWTRRVTPSPGDVVFSYETRIGEAALIPAGLRCCLGRRMGLLRPKGDKVDPRFLLYAYLGPGFQDILRSRTIHGSTVNRIPLTEMGKFPIEIPATIREQRRIAQVLGTLDDKIELSRRINETLETMAWALFKSWFVDFDPVRAKMDDRDPGLPQHLADLFPNRLVESELGEIPEGWEVKTLRECTHLTMGQSPPGRTYNERGEGLPFFQGRTDFGFRYPSNRRFCSVPTRIAQPGDTLVSVRAPVGDINMAWDRCCIGRGVAALRHKSGTASFTYYSARKIQVALQEYEHTGTVFGAINKGQFEALLVIEPHTRIIDAFDAYSGAIDAKIKSNTRESRVLVALRDTLLPKLISATIRVPESHKQTGAFV